MRNERLEKGERRFDETRKGKAPGPFPGG